MGRLVCSPRHTLLLINRERERRWTKHFDEEKIDEIAAQQFSFSIHQLFGVARTIFATFRSSNWFDYDCSSTMPNNMNQNLRLEIKTMDRNIHELRVARCLVSMRLISVGDKTVILIVIAMLPWYSTQIYVILFWLHAKPLTTNSWEKMLLRLWKLWKKLKIWNKYIHRKLKTFWCNWESHYCMIAILSRCGLQLKLPNKTCEKESSDRLNGRWINRRMGVSILVQNNKTCSVSCHQKKAHNQFER